MRRLVPEAGLASSELYQLQSDHLSIPDWGKGRHVMETRSWNRPAYPGRTEPLQFPDGLKWTKRGPAPSLVNTTPSPCKVINPHGLPRGYLECKAILWNSATTLTLFCNPGCGAAGRASHHGASLIP